MTKIMCPGGGKEVTHGSATVRSGFSWDEKTQRYRMELGLIDMNPMEAMSCGECGYEPL